MMAGPAAILAAENDKTLHFSSRKGMKGKGVDKDIGKRIKRLMKRRNLTQRKLADIVGVSESMISHYTTGRRVPSGPALSKIASALDVDPAYLVWGEEGSPEPEIKLAMQLLRDSIPKMTVSQRTEVRRTVSRLIGESVHRG